MEDVRFPLYYPLSLLWGYRSVRFRTAVMSTHTGGFTDIAMEDLTDHISACYIVLAIMILPTVINMSVSSIQAVPQQMRAASLALVSLRKTASEV